MNINNLNEAYQLKINLEQLEAMETAAYGYPRPTAYFNLDGHSIALSHSQVDILLKQRRSALLERAEELGVELE